MTVELTKTPSFRLDGRRALVTGAGRGIGLAAAERRGGARELWGATGDFVFYDCGGDGRARGRLRRDPACDGVVMDMKRLLSHGLVELFGAIIVAGMILWLFHWRLG